jgi:hypothetical protein
MQAFVNANSEKRSFPEKYFLDMFIVFAFIAKPPRKRSQLARRVSRADNIRIAEPIPQSRPSGRLRGPIRIP